MNILVVDDVGYSRHYHCRLLQKFGHQAEAVETGPQALKRLEQDAAVDVVLTDLMMRDMDGIELFKQAQRMNAGAEAGSRKPPTFILMTALRPGKDASQQKDVEKIRLAKELGFAEVLFKPIEPEALKAAIEGVRAGQVQSQLDTSGVQQLVTKLINQLVATEQVDAAEQFLDAMHGELGRLDEFLAQAMVKAG